MFSLYEFGLMYVRDHIFSCSINYFLSLRFILFNFFTGYIPSLCFRQGPTNISSSCVFRATVWRGPILTYAAVPLGHSIEERICLPFSSSCSYPLHCTPDASQSASENWPFSQSQCWLLMVELLEKQRLPGHP